MQCMAAAVGLQTAWESVPDELKTGIPHQWVTYGTVALLVLGMLGRMVKQEPQDKP